MAEAGNYTQLMLKKIGVFILLSLSSCSLIKHNGAIPKTEFRAVWIATVVNIDWPQRGGDPWEKQKEEYLHILDFYKALNFNAVVVQIRTAGDAFYESNLAPWSRFLTGEEGIAPETDQNPLKWMIKEAHIRGFEFHAWLNPYRATFDLNTDVLSESHDYFKHPDWMIKYGKKYYYNPGLPEVQKHMVSIIEEVVSQYDIDAIHFDDYFYPYTINNEVFNDSLTHLSNNKAELSLEDWRRSNIDTLVKQVHQVIKEQKPWVQFGISPFGVWKNIATDPKGSDTKAGQTTYEDLFADPLLWMENGWIDYLVPQIYWSLKLPVASHRILIDWWAENQKNSNLYIGNGAYKVRNNSDKAWDKMKELPKQLQLARKTAAVQGNVFFSARSLMKGNEDVVNYIKNRLYSYPSFTPVSPLIINEGQPLPELNNMIDKDNYLKLTFNFFNNENIRFANIYEIKKSKKLPVCEPKNIITQIFMDNSNSFNLGKGLIEQRKNIAVTFTDKFRKESEPIVIHLSEINSYDTKK
ncbi:family 10 glycosylhydrolase [bacterium]|nr:family 10 glycosylhydrolase [bacterium]